MGFSRQEHWSGVPLPSLFLSSNMIYLWLFQVLIAAHQLSLGAAIGDYSLVAMAPTPALLPGKSHGRRSLVGCSPWGRQESDTTERLHFDFSLSCIGEGDGNPLQCSCLENPRDGGAWWAAVYGVAQSWTRLKQLSSSSSSLGVIHLVGMGFDFVLIVPTGAL